MLSRMTPLLCLTMETADYKYFKKTNMYLLATTQTQVYTVKFVSSQYVLINGSFLFEINDQKSVTAFFICTNCIHRKRIHLLSKIMLKTKIEQSLLLKVAAM